jgi:hypothetical protein
VKRIVKKRYWVVENERERKKKTKKSKRKTDRSTNREVDKSKQKTEHGRNAKKKQRERELHQVGELETHKSMPGAVPSLGVAETHFLILLLTICFHAVFFRHGL